CDALGISRTVTKWNVQIRALADIPDTVRHAVKQATTGRPGPVLIDVPKDIQGQTVIAHAEAVPSPTRLPLADLPIAALPSDFSLCEAARLIAASRKPIFYGGGGLINSGHKACVRFTRMVRGVNAPCTLTLMGLGAFP